MQMLNACVSISASDNKQSSLNGLAFSFDARLFLIVFDIKRDPKGIGIFQNGMNDNFE